MLRYEIHVKGRKKMLKEVDSSPAMMMQTSDSRKKYPWDTLAIGKSFIVPHGDIKYETLYKYANRMGKKLGKRFKVVNHVADAIYEVGLIEILNKSLEQATVKNDKWALKTAEPTGADKFKKMGF
jgi:hypothetical protein